MDFDGPQGAKGGQFQMGIQVGISLGLVYILRLLVSHPTSFKFNQELDIEVNVTCLVNV